MDSEMAETTWRLINRAADLLRSDAVHAGGIGLETITVSQQNVLGTVYTHPDSGLMVKDIASEINVTRGAVSQTVESLVKLGMLERVQSEEDRRAVFVRATPKGIAIRKKLTKRIHPILNEVLNEVDMMDRESFIRILERLVERLSKVNAEKRESEKSSRRSAVEKVR